MTPILVILFGFNPTMVIGTDIVHGAVFKTFGALILGLSGVKLLDFPGAFVVAAFGTCAAFTALVVAILRASRVHRRRGELIAIAPQAEQ